MSNNLIGFGTNANRRSLELLNDADDDSRYRFIDAFSGSQVYLSDDDEDDNGDAADVPFRGKTLGGKTLGGKTLGGKTFIPREGGKRYQGDTGKVLLSEQREEDDESKSSSSSSESSSP